MFFYNFLFSQAYLLIRLFFVLCLLSSSLFAMIGEESEETSNTVIHKASLTHPKPSKEETETAEQIKARDRLAFIQKQYEQNSNLTMLEPLSGLQEFYERDLAFIRKAIQQSRENSELFIKALDDFDEEVKECYFQKMSMADYNFIARIWVTLLSSKDLEVAKESIKIIQENYDYVLKVFQDTKKIADGFHMLDLIGAYGIIMPHVSPTGSVPIKVINDGYGFVVNNETPGSVDFLAVGTNLKLNFDYLTDESCFFSWYHDWEHAQRASRMGGSGESYKKKFFIRVKNIAKLRMKIKEISNVHLRNQAEFAFFDLFHESQKSMELIKDQIDERINKIKERLKTGVEPTTGFNSLKQFETYIKGAQSLNLPIKGEGTLEQYYDFLRHLQNGYEFLATLAEGYDEYFETEREKLYWEN